MSVAGTRHFGKVNVVPNLFYVATKFFHINFVPLIPLGSSVIFANSEQEQRLNGVETQTTFLATRIPFSWKSFFAAYVRLILWVSSIASVAFFAFNVAQHLSADNMQAKLGKFADTNMLATSGAAVFVSAFLLYWSYRFAVASEERALELGKLLGISETTVREHLAFEGYPFHRRGPKQHVWQCPHCNTINRLIAKDGRGSCVRCGAIKTVAPPTPLVDALIFAGIIGIIALFVWFTNYASHPSSKSPVIKEPAYSTPAARQPAGLAPSYPVRTARAPL